MSDARRLQDARVVPWSSWSEWARLRAALDAGDLATAEAYATVYRLRRAAGLPAALQASVTLAGQRAAFGGTYDERLALAMALSRLVNALTDQLQPTGTTARAKSVRILARQLGLPPDLVSLRHQACHNALPGAPALASGAEAACEWLERRYWAVQAAAARKEEEDCDTVAALRAVFEGAEEGVVEEERGVTGEEDVLVRMRRVAKEAEEKLKARSEVGEGKGCARGVKKRRWALCGNEELWKKMPLGLAPGQTEVCTVLTNFEEGGRQEDVEGDVVDDFPEGGSVCEVDAAMPRKKRRLDEREISYLRSEWPSLQLGTQSGAV